VRKLFVVAGLAAATLSLGAFSAVHADQEPGGVEGCVAESPAPAPPAGTVYSGSCSYTATRTGGYATAAQTWSVTIYNNNSPTKTVLHAFSSTAGSNPCNTGPVIQPGNYVVATVANGVNAVGNPTPSAAGAVPSSSDNCTSAP